MKICENCKKEHEGTYGSGRFCSSKCARGFSTKSKRKEINEVVKKKLTHQPRIKICKFCNVKFAAKRMQQQFCCRSCNTRYNNKYNKLGLNGGRSSAQHQNKRSKNEIYFSKLCIQYFNNVLLNAPIFNGWDADVIIEDFKIAVLWNGKWHYEKITKKHSLKQVQNRDKIKSTEIKSLGYTPYLIKDMGKYNKNFVENEFNKLKIYCGMEKLVISEVS
jgi:hypothetical protein